VGPVGAPGDVADVGEDARLPAGPIPNSSIRCERDASTSARIASRSRAWNEDRSRFAPPGTSSARRRFSRLRICARERDSSSRRVREQPIQTARRGALALEWVQRLLLAFWQFNLAADRLKTVADSRCDPSGEA
jgi:hypothetical protein